MSDDGWIVRLYHAYPEAGFAKQFKQLDPAYVSVSGGMTCRKLYEKIWQKMQGWYDLDIKGNVKSIPFSVYYTEENSFKSNRDLLLPNESVY